MNLWHRLPVFFGLIYLGIRRHLHQQYNLINVGTTPKGLLFNPADYPYRTTNGEYNDPFARALLMKPDPVVVAVKLLSRKKFIDTGKQFNMIAASWIQFMIHDWIDHLEETNQLTEIVAPPEVASQCPLKKFRFYKTKEVPTGDGSAIYGSDAKKNAQVRTFKNGKLKIADSGLLQHGQDGIAISGDVRNSWAGVSTLQALFIREHNVVCDAIKSENPFLNDEELYRHARLVIAAVIAKIHTIDWTVELLKTDTLYVGMYANWVPMIDLIGLKGEKTLTDIGFTGYLVSMGHQASGALEIWNYPKWLSDIISQNPDGSERPDHVDMPALEIYRDRERKVPRYNHFRRSMLMIPISKWEDLTDDAEVIKTLREVYGDNIEKLDLLVGLMAEKKIKGFAISETAFFIFVLMASRRLEADRFFTSDFNEETYTKKGLEWVNTTESLRDVITRHYPEITEKWMNSTIYRDREKKVPRYNHFRRSMLMVPISKWEDLTDDAEVIKTLREVYGDNI
ncbi:Alpha-dioxygenase 1 [Acorus calamus]|uniref:Alpha-dioxygenase 1 n=1 Tax=Acorus calamus TaxID=4465 RepID=A0AAV9EVE7_ACOCL|nr:Alpha-dioxygenase 1 [Acorus calamus]